MDAMICFIDGNSSLEGKLRETLYQGLDIMCYLEVEHNVLTHVLNMDIMSTLISALGFGGICIVHTPCVSEQ